MKIAHVSDFHVSRYGNVYEQRKSPPKDAGMGEWQAVSSRDGWTIELSKAQDKPFQFKDHLRLVDPHRIVHATRKVKATDMSEAVADLQAWVDRRMRAHHERLVEDFPSAEQAKAWLAEDPENTNLRFCALVGHLEEVAPDWVIITGDLTEDGVGYDLVRRGLQRWVEHGRLLAIPGNHDIYPSMPLVVPKGHRRTEADKRKLWGAFAASIGIPANGSYLREIDEGVVVAGLDSCHPPKVPASASGLILEKDLNLLEGQLTPRATEHEVRLLCLHHHIANPPSRITGSAPLQAGMRLRNARRVVDSLQSMGLDLVLNGHRHMGYRYHPARMPLFLSSPSATLGCRSGLGPYFWLIEVEGGEVRRTSDVHIHGIEPLFWG